MDKILGQATLEKAMATAIYAATSVIIVNLVDPSHQLYSPEWWKHLFIGWAGTTLVMEAKYWREWAKTILNGKMPQGGIDAEKIINDDKL